MKLTRAEIERLADRRIITRAAADALLNAKANPYNVAPRAERTWKGKVYASKAEMHRAMELDLMVKAGKLRSVKAQPTYELGTRLNRYRADFEVTDSDGRVWVEDVKGRETRDFKRTRRLWKEYGPHPLQILTRAKRGWDREIIQGAKQNAPDRRQGFCGQC